MGELFGLRDRSRENSRKLNLTPIQRLIVTEVFYFIFSVIIWREGYFNKQQGTERTGSVNKPAVTEDDKRFGQPEQGQFLALCP